MNTYQFEIGELMNKYKKVNDKLFNHKIISSAYDYWLNNKKIYTIDEVIKELKRLNGVELSRATYLLK